MTSIDTAHNVSTSTAATDVTAATELNAAVTAASRAAVAATNAAAIALFGAFVARDALSPFALVMFVVVAIVGPRWLAPSFAITSATTTSNDNVNTGGVDAYAAELGAIAVATLTGALAGRALAAALGTARVVDVAGPSAPAPLGLVRRVPYALVVVVGTIVVVSGVARFVDDGPSAAAWLETLGGVAVAFVAYAALVFVVDDTTTAAWMLATTLVAGAPAAVYGATVYALESRASAAALAIVASALATALVVCAASLVNVPRHLLTPHNTPVVSTSLPTTTVNASAPFVTRRVGTLAGALACHFAFAVLVYLVGSAAAHPDNGGGARAVARALIITFVVVVAVFCACAACAVCALRTSHRSATGAAKRAGDGTQTIVTTWHPTSSATAHSTTPPTTTTTRARRTFNIPNARV